MVGEPIELTPARAHFIEAWPEVLKPWSLPKAAARIHALLISTKEALTADQVRNTLALSAGSASTQLRFLAAVGLIEKLRIVGSRKARYRSLSDPARMFMALAEVRRRHAFEAMRTMAPAITSIAGKEDLEWLQTLWQLQSLSEMMDAWLETCATQDPEWTVRLIQKASMSNIHRE